MSMTDTAVQAAKVDPFGKILSGLILAAILWLGNTVSENSLTLAKNGERMASFQRQIAALTAEQNTIAQLRMDSRVMEGQIEWLTEKVAKLEGGRTHAR